MSSTSNYNAITNLTETIIDYLVVDTAEIDTALIENLDCNVGTIDTLTSTTATITSANIPTLTSTTAGITTANTTTANITTANISTANITTENTTTANITTANITNNNSTNTNISSLTASKIVLTDASKNLISSLYTDTDFARLTANNTFTGLNTFSGATNTFSNTLLCNTIRGTTAGSAISLFSTSTGTLTFGNTSNSNSITLNNNVSLSTDKALTINGEGYLIIASAVGRENAFIRVERLNSWANVNPIELWTSTVGLITLGNVAGTITINSITTFTNSMIMANNKNITLSGSGKITTPNILVSGLTANRLILTDASDNLISSLYNETTLPVSTPQQTALNLKANIASPTFTGVITTPAILVSGLTASKIVLTDASDNLVSSPYDTSTLPVSTPTQTALDLKADKASPTFTGVITAPEIRCPLYNSTNATTNMSLGSTSTSSSINIGQVQTSGNISIGNSTPASDSGGLTINKFTTLGAGKSLTLSSTSNFISDNIRGTAIGTSTSIYPTTTSGSITIGSAQTSGNVTIGNSTPASDSGGLTINKTTTFGAGKDLIFSSTGRIRVDRIVGSTPLSSDINIGYTDPAYIAYILLNQDTIVASNRILFCNTMRGLTAGSDISLFLTTDTGSITIGGGLTSGSLNLGVNGMSGQINLNGDVNVLDSIISDNYIGKTASSLVRFCGTTTTGDLRIAETQTSGNVSIGNSTPASDSGTLTINKNTTISTGKVLKTENIQSLTATTIMNIGSTNTTANVNIGGALTSGNVDIHNSSYTTGKINLNAPVVCPDLTLNSTEINLGTSSATSQGAYAIAIGYFAGGNGTQGSQAVAIGNNAGYSNQAGDCIAIGYQAQYSSTVAVGSRIRAIGIGYQAQQTNFNQGIAIGDRAGNAGQGIHSIGIGSVAGQTTQGNYGIAIGRIAGQVGQKAEAIAMGFSAGQTNQGTNSIAIGSYAGQTNQAMNSIVINASGVGVNGNTAGSFYVRPMGAVGSFTNFVSYNPATYEVYYTPSSATYKDNVINLERNFDDVLELQSREYRFNQRGNDACIGYIAEEVYDINKEFSTTNEDGGAPSNIAWFNIVVYQNEVIKENRRRIETLEANLSALMLRVDNLET